MTNEIFLIMTERYQGEDNSGRDIYAFTYDPECDPGFFATKEAAQDWIDNRNAEAQTKYEAQVAEYEPKRRLFDANRQAADEAWEAYKVATEATGANAGFKPFVAPPSAPRKGDFFANYEIHAIVRED